jgi:GNAT superfamily N-acetyltransferase
MAAQPDSPLLAWSPLTDADLPRWHRLVTTIAQADGAQEWLTEEDLADELRAPWRDPVLDTTIGVDENGTAHAVGVVDLRPGDRTLLRVHCFGGVDPGWRALGIGRRLLDWQLRRAGEVVAVRRAELGERVPARATAELDERWTSATRLAERAGLRAIRWSTTMRRDLVRPVPAVAVPSGLRLTGYRPELDERIRLAHNEAFADHWGFQPWTSQAWSHWATGHRDFRTDCSFVVLDGDEVAGYALSATYPGDWEPAGFTQGWTSKLGVRRPWRGRLDAVLPGLRAGVRGTGGGRRQSVRGGRPVREARLPGPPPLSHLGGRPISGPARKFVGGLMLVIMHARTASPPRLTAAVRACMITGKVGVVNRWCGPAG